MSNTEDDNIFFYRSDLIRNLNELCFNRQITANEKIAIRDRIDLYQANQSNKDLVSLKVVQDALQLLTLESRIIFDTKYKVLMSLNAIAKITQKQ